MKISAFISLLFLTLATAGPLVFEARDVDAPGSIIAARGLDTSIIARAIDVAANNCLGCWDCPWQCPPCVSCKEDEDHFQTSVGPVCTGACPPCAWCVAEPCSCETCFGLCAPTPDYSLPENITMTVGEWSQLVTALNTTSLTIRTIDTSPLAGEPESCCPCWICHFACAICKGSETIPSAGVKITATQYTSLAVAAGPDSTFTKAHEADSAILPPTDSTSFLGKCNGRWICKPLICYCMDDETVAPDDATTTDRQTVAAREDNFKSRQDPPGLVGFQCYPWMECYKWQHGGKRDETVALASIASREDTTDGLQSRQGLIGFQCYPWMECYNWHNGAKSEETVSEFVGT